MRVSPVGALCVGASVCARVVDARVFLPQRAAKRVSETRHVVGDAGQLG